MAGLYNTQGQFGGLWDNWQMNQYNNAMRDWEQQNQQYQQDVSYWDQMNQYDQSNQNFDVWSSGRDQGPMAPRRRPDVIGPAPSAPEQFNFGGAWGGQGGGGFQPSPWTGGGGGVPAGYEGGQYTAPDPFTGQMDTSGVVDVSAAIASAQPGIMENMNNAFADAGNRFGSSGMVGTPYAGALGEASRGAANDLANIANQYTFQANTDAANRQHDAAKTNYQGDLNAWGQSGQWGHEGQLNDLNQDYGAWAQAGDWQNAQNMQNNANNFGAWQNTNNWAFQDYQNQQNQQQQMMQMMMAMMGGG